MRQIQWACADTWLCLIDASSGYAAVTSGSDGIFRMTQITEGHTCSGSIRCASLSDLPWRLKVTAFLAMSNAASQMPEGLQEVHAHWLKKHYTVTRPGRPTKVGMLWTAAPDKTPH
jgi:hypothetical protein